MLRLPLGVKITYSLCFLSIIIFFEGRRRGGLLSPSQTLLGLVLNSLPEFVTDLNNGCEGDYEVCVVALKVPNINLAPQPPPRTG